MNGWRSGVVVGEQCGSQYEWMEKWSSCGCAMEYWESSSMNGWRSGVVVGVQWNIGSHLV